MNPIGKVWFWLLMISIVLLIIAIVMFEIEQSTTTPLWIWIIFGIAILLIIVSLVLYIIDYIAYVKQMKIMRACCPPPEPEVIECPKNYLKSQPTYHCEEEKLIEPQHCTPQSNYNPNSSIKVESHYYNPEPQYHTVEHHYYNPEPQEYCPPKAEPHPCPSSNCPPKVEPQYCPPKIEPQHCNPKPQCPPKEVLVPIPCPNPQPNQVCVVREEVKPCRVVEHWEDEKVVVPTIVPVPTAPIIIPDIRGNSRIQEEILDVKVSEKDVSQKLRVPTTTTVERNVRVVQEAPTPAIPNIPQEIPAERVTSNKFSTNISLSPDYRASTRPRTSQKFSETTRTLLPDNDKPVDLRDTIKRIPPAGFQIPPAEMIVKNNF